MPTTPIFAARSAKDADKIVRAGVRSAQRVSGTIRARILRDYNTGFRFHVRPFIIQQLEALLTNVMLAGHLGGFRRLHLIRRQNPSLMRRIESGQLKLSHIDDVVKFLQSRANLDLNNLQKKYKTEAIKVLNTVSDDVEKQLRQTVDDLIKSGAHVREAKEVLGEKFDALGLTPKNPFQLETIFRTQTQIAFGAGKFEAEQDPDIQEILWGYKYVTVGDDRVRENHAILDGTTLPKDDPFWQRFYPPNGWNCRCQAIPIFEEREVKEAPQTLEDGEPVNPDKGFDFNPGKLLS